MKGRRLLPRGGSAGTEGQAQGEFVSRGGVARAKDAGFASGTKVGEQLVAAVDKRVFHKEFFDGITGCRRN